VQSVPISETQSHNEASFFAYFAEFLINVQVFITAFHFHLGKPDKVAYDVVFFRINSIIIRSKSWQELFKDSKNFFWLQLAKPLITQQYEIRFYQDREFVMSIIQNNQEYEVSFAEEYNSKRFNQNNV